MFELGTFYNDKKEIYTLKINDKSFTSADYHALAKKFAALVKFREALPVRDHAKRWVDVLNQYATPTATMMVVADITINSGQAIRKAWNRCLADMDRGHYPTGECMGLTIFSLCENYPNFCHVFFKLQHEYLEQ